MSGALLMAASMPRAADEGGGGPGPGDPITISDHEISTVGDGTTTITASITYRSTGITANHNGATLETWLASGSAGDYEVMATLQDGAAPTAGAMDTWLPLSSNRTWSLTIGAGEDLTTSTFLIEIREVPNQKRDSATITLSAQNNA